MYPGVISVLKGCSCQPTSRNFKLCCLLMAVVMVYYGYQVYDDNISHVYQHGSYATPCEIPEVDPFDVEMMKYIRRPAPLECHKNPTPVVYVDENNTLQFNVSALMKVGEIPSTVHCDYHFIIRSTEKYKTDTHVEFSKPIPFSPPIDITADFVRVVCRGASGNRLFDNIITKILRSNKTFEKVNPDEDKYNIMMFGIDSVSRASAIRQLPNTFQYLTEDLRAMDFKGYTKVQDNTFPNIIYGKTFLQKDM